MSDQRDASVGGTSRRGMSLTVKILAPTLALLVGVVGINYWVFMRSYTKDATGAWIAKASSFTAVADEAKNHQSKLITEHALAMDDLKAEAVEVVARGGDYKDTRFFSAIPVIVGWQAASKAAEREGIDFGIAAFEARNPDNAPAKGSFREELLRELTRQVESGGDDFIGKVDPATDTLHYMRAIRLDKTCMVCHGDPAVYDQRDEHGSYDGKDFLGFEMENWDVGYMHGAYEVAMPLEPMHAQVASFFTKGMMWTVPLVVGAGVGFVFLLRSLLGRPLNNLIAMVREVATGDGDLTKRLSLQRGDEIGRLGHWFDVFLDGLHGIIAQVRDATNSVASASAEIAASAEEMARGLTQQEQQTQQVAAAVEEMSQSVTEVARKSADAASAAEQSRKSAHAGGEVVGQTVAEMQGIASEVRGSAERVVSLGQKSEQIGEIISVINDIADQTNLLALNAAIEAARAGEHGRGFAVVADEVRKLAERTQQATQQVSSSIREIQADTGSAVQRIEAGSERVGKGVELASNAGRALEEIFAASDGVQSMVQGIAAAAEQQSAASEQIARSVEQISSVTRESSQGAGQASEAAVDLSRQADLLQNLIGRFKL